MWPSGAPRPPRSLERRRAEGLEVELLLRSKLGFVERVAARKPSPRPTGREPAHMRALMGNGVSRV